MKHSLSSSLNFTNPRFTNGFRILGLAAFIFVTGRLSQTLVITPGNLAVIWLPPGIGLAALVLWGYRVWPGILLGGFLVGNTPFFQQVVAPPWPLAAGVGLTIAAGMTLQALIGAFLLNHLTRGRQTFETTRTAIIYVALSLPLCIISTTVSIVSLALTGFVAWRDFISLWYKGWFGDVASIMLITSFILVWGSPFRLKWNTTRVIEGAGLAASVGLVGLIVFSTNSPIGFLYFPLILWAMLRFELRGTTLVLLLIISMIIWNTTQRVGLFIRPNLSEALLFMQAFNTTFVATTLIGLAFISERKQARLELAEYYRTLEQKIEERTRELARMTQIAQEARAAAEDANRSKSQFLTNMSHELRTPLNAIIGYSEMLQEEALDNEQTGAVADLKKIEAAGKHLLHLVNDILDLSKIEAGKMELYLEDFEVTKLVETVVTTVEPLIHKKGNRLNVQLAPGLGQMHSDVTKVRQTLLNLLSNAAKFTDHGTVSLTVQQATTAQGEFINFTISDSGIGMTAEQLGRLFQAFTQADSSTSRNYGGTGLGLVISRRFCQMLGGDITVESTPGQGSTFTFSLPVRVAAPTQLILTPPDVALVS